MPRASEDLKAVRKQLAELQKQVEALEKKALEENAKILSSKRIYLNDEVYLDFVMIPAQKFMMGSNDGHSDEKPVHEVNIQYEYGITDTVLTQEQ